MGDHLRRRAGAQRRDAGLELRRRCAGAERHPRSTEVGGEPANGGGDAGSGRSLARAFERALDQWLDRQARALRRVDDDGHGGARVRSEPLESRVLGGDLHGQ